MTRSAQSIGMAGGQVLHYHLSVRPVAIRLARRSRRRTGRKPKPRSSPVSARRRYDPAITADKSMRRVGRARSLTEGMRRGRGGSRRIAARVAERSGSGLALPDARGRWSHDPLDARVRTTRGRRERSEVRVRLPPALDGRGLNDRERRPFLGSPPTTWDPPHWAGVRSCIATPRRATGSDSTRSSVAASNPPKTEDQPGSCSPALGPLNRADKSTPRIGTPDRLRSSQRGGEEGGRTAAVSSPHRGRAGHPVPGRALRPRCRARPLGRARRRIRAAHARRVSDVPAQPVRDRGGGFAEPASASPAAAREPASPTEPPVRRGWTGGRIALVVVGTIAGLLALGLLVGGCALVAVDQTQRDDDGFLMSPTQDFSTRTYAIVSEDVDLGDEGAERALDTFLGTVRIRSESGRPVFVGIGPAGDVTRYLGGVERDVVDDLENSGDPEYSRRSGGAPHGRPGDETFWVASTTGAGERTLDWEPEDGDWRAVVMNEDGSRRVSAELSIGAELDSILWIGLGLLVAGALFAAGCALAITAATRSRR